MSAIPLREFRHKGPQSIVSKAVRMCAARHIALADVRLSYPFTCSLPGRPIGKTLKGALKSLWTSTFSFFGKSLGGAPN